MNYSHNTNKELKLSLNFEKSFSTTMLIEFQFSPKKSLSTSY